MFRALLSIVGRISLAAIFVMSAVGNKIPKFETVAAYMEAEKVPNPKIALAGAIVFLLVGGTLLITGFWARFGALLLAVFIAAATYYFHDFWTLEDVKGREEQMIQFMKNLSIFGALMFIVANGGGAGCFDFRRREPPLS
jgi:putative oxidoreductase